MEIWPKMKEKKITTYPRVQRAKDKLLQWNKNLSMGHVQEENAEHLILF